MIVRKDGQLKDIQQQNSGCINIRKCHGCKARYDCYRLSYDVNIACCKCEYMYSVNLNYEAYCKSCNSFFKSKGLKCNFKYCK